MSVIGIGLNLGERLEIAGGKYEILNDVVDVQRSIGKIRFLGIGSPVLATETVEVNGRSQEVTNGEIKGHVLDFVYDGAEGDSVVITEMSRSDIESLGLKPLEYVELVDPVLTISRMPRGNSQLKLFAAGLKKVGAEVPSPSQPQGQENKKDNKQ